MCPTQSVPALVDKAYWTGAHSTSNTLVNCLAKVLSTKRRTEDPVAIHLTPPSGFARAVNLADMIAGVTSAGTLACVTLVQAASKSSIVSHSSSNTLGCSHVHPPVPGEDPRRALFKLVRNVALSNSTGTSGSNSNTSCVNGPVLQCAESVLVPWGQCCSCQILPLQDEPPCALLSGVMLVATLGQSICTARLASSNRIRHWPSENLSNRLDSSSFPTFPTPLALRNNMNGNKRNNFHARTSIV